MSCDPPDATPAGTEVSRLLADWRQGDPAGAGRLFSLLYDELYAVARRRLWRWQPGETLCTTALVHEAYLKLAPGAAANDRAHFFALAAKAMRQIVVDRARHNAAAKRGAAFEITTFDEAAAGMPHDTANVVFLDEALERLERADARLGQVVELRFFAGFSVAETAAALGTSTATVKRDWRAARAFLVDALTPAHP